MIWVLNPDQPKLTEFAQAMAKELGAVPGLPPLLLRHRMHRNAMRRPSAPPRAEAESNGKNLKTPNKSAVAQAPGRSANRRAAAVMFGQGAPIAVGR